MSVQGQAQGPNTGGPRPQRSALVVFCTAVLTLEAFVVFFATLVAIGFDLAPRPVIWGAGLSAVALCLVAAGLARRPAGRVAGTVVQAGLIAAGFVIGAMFVVGVIFTALWVTGLLLGRRIDRERAERIEAERQAGGHRSRGEQTGPEPH